MGDKRLEKCRTRERKGREIDMFGKKHWRIERNIEGYRGGWMERERGWMDEESEELNDI